MASGSERVGQKDECFSLKWNVHHAETFEAFESLRFKDSLVDVSLCCEGHILKAHKLVLSACSPYFERILHDVGLRYPVLMFQDVPMYMMQLLLQFMYRGEVEIHSSILPNFIKLAESLDVKGLRKDREPGQGQRPNQQGPRGPNPMNGDKGFNSPLKPDNIDNCLEPCVQVSHDSSNLDAATGGIKREEDGMDDDVKGVFDDGDGADDDGSKSDDNGLSPPNIEDGCNEGEEGDLSLDMLRRDLKSTMIVPLGPDHNSAGPSAGRSPHWSSPGGGSHSMRPSHSPAAAAAAAGTGGLGAEHPASIPLDISTEYEMYRVNGAIWRGYTHTRRVMYFCHFCDYKSPLKGNAVNHGRRHLGEKPFACPICGKAFTAVQNMKTHQMTHARDSLPPGMRIPPDGANIFGHSFVF